MSEKVTFFKTRTDNHINSVQSWAKKIEKAFPKMLEGLFTLSTVHDASKYQEPEYTPYLEVTWHYKCKAEGEDYPLNEDAHLATFHHIKNNPHHPEYHDPNATLECLNSHDRDKPSKYIVNATAMPTIFIGEMVADWCSVATERNTDPYEWAKMNIGIRWKFSKHQEELIYKILDSVWEVKI